ncbi:MAG: wax ester/triacylglycerol synthase family O-acyltransferase [Deltaproteobacteria bacterium]|nr:wax ester/triacylglycerol synthase family O-acyltransferase [Deltaproteobacteria bacterium]
MEPGRYIEKVSLLTGEILPDEITPRELLVHSHRDYHVVDVQARWLMSRLVDAIGDEDAVVKLMKDARQLGLGTTEILSNAIGDQASKLLARKLLGLKDREYFFRYKRHPLERAEIERRLEALRRRARDQLAAAVDDQGRMSLRVLLTGGTGFVGKEILWQAARDPAIGELVVLIRPKQIADRKTGAVLQTLTPAQRGASLLAQLGLEVEASRKVRFIDGDIEQPNLGVSEADMAVLAATITHVIHCAASVSFDDPYESSFRANVDGAVNALAFSERLQAAPNSPFVAHISIETSYIHGRQTRQPAREEEVVFPRNFYNNYYELTKAMGSIETERSMIERGLRVTQLCPSIVIGEARTGNNRGDTKVVNAPVNVFGKVRDALEAAGGSWRERSRAQILARMACAFPGDPSAQLNIIPVDWVVRGVVASLKHPEAVGERVHLATDQRLTSDELRQTVLEEIGVDIRLAEPTLHRNVTLPVMSRVLQAAGQERVANGLEKLGQIFGGYSEWGQPIHEVGNDHSLLDLPAERPNTRHAFRMLCRHNRWVQHFGQIRDLDEIARRERVWAEMIAAIEADLGRPAAALPPEQFREEMHRRLDLERFVPISAGLPSALASHLDAGDEPLGAVDTAWLQMDRRDNPMIILAMALFDAPLDFARFRARVEERFLSFDRFRQRISAPAGLGRPTWEIDRHFDLEHHLIRHQLAGDEASLNALIDRLASDRLNMDRPPWQLHLVGRDGRGSALLIRLHHCLGDGAALVYAMLSLTDPVEVERPEAPAVLGVSEEKRGSLGRLFQRVRQSGVALHAKVEALVDPRWTLDVAKLGLSSAAALGKLVLMPADADTALRGPLGPKKRVAWSKPMSLVEIKAIGRALGATVNDVLMSALSGAFRTYLKSKSADVPESIRAVIPVNLRPAGEIPDFGNQFGLVFLPLPVGLDHELQRVEQVRASMDELKKSPEALVSLKALAGIGRLQTAIEGKTIEMFTNKASIVASNVPGPFQRLFVLGQPVESCIFWVPQSGSIGVGVSILSYAGEVRIGVSADAGLVDDPRTIVAAFEQEVASLGAGLS